DELAARPARVERLLLFLIVRLVVVLPHREALEALPEHHPPQVVVADEADAEQVPDLALLQVGAAPDRLDRGDLGLLAGEVRLEHQRRPGQRRAVEVVDDLEAAAWSIGGAAWSVGG